MGLVRYIKNQFRHDRNMKRMIDANATALSGLEQEIKHEAISRRVDLLKAKVMSCDEQGVTEENYGEEIIVSLTSFGKRINEVYLAIESIMQGTLKPNRIVLWLAEDEFEGKVLPQTLMRQQKRGLQIEFCEDIRSYKKIVPTLLKYPEACVVTIDDDAMYEFDLLENLIRTHQENPNDICACRMHRIALNNQDKPKSYLEWELLVYPEDKSPLLFLTSGGGALFPSHCFEKEFFNHDAYMSLCPYADDVWINAMIWKSGRRISKAYTHSKWGCDFVDISLNQEESLSEKNLDASSCQNDVQLKAVMDQYDLYHYLVEQ